jgi:hypothetical protein
MRTILDEHIIAASEIPNDESNPEIITINEDEQTVIPSKYALNN